MAFRKRQEQLLRGIIVERHGVQHQQSLHGIEVSQKLGRRRFEQGFALVPRLKHLLQDVFSRTAGVQVHGTIC
ncbi:MAG: hypothetical protein ACLP4R_23275 [Solirubrobacteraceae bacterium]